MKNKFAIALLLVVTQFTVYAQKVYQLNITNSKLLWTSQTGGHFGYILFNSGTLIYSEAAQPVSGIFKIDMHSLRSQDSPDASGNKKTDNLLASVGFFDVAKYPEAVMDVKQIVPTGSATLFKVTGELTMKGIKNSVEFIATIKKDGKIITAKADFKISRAKWNIDMQQQPKSWDMYSAVKNKILVDDISISLDLSFDQ